MSISLVQQPDILSFSKNPVIYKLETDNYVTVEGVKSYVIFRLDGDPSVGSTVTITWDLGEVIFTLALLPDNSGTIIRTQGVLSASEYAEQTVEDLNSNYNLTKDFIITAVDVSGETYIKVEAREPGTDYSITLDNSLLGGGSIDIVSPTPVAGVDQEVQENFKIILDVIVVEEDGDIVVVSLDQIPDEDSQVEFDISEVLDKYISTLSKELPTYAATSIVATNNIIKTYFVRYHESYGDPVEHFYITSSEDRYVIDGGIKKEDWPSNTITSNLTSNSKRFLTWHPTEKEINNTQREYLYYYMDDSLTSLKLRILITFTDGTTSEFNIKTFSSPAQYVIFIVPTGFEQLSLSTYEVDDLEIKKYTVWMVDQDDNVRSEERTYIIDNFVYESERFFLYKTSLGGYDTIRAIGEADKSSKIDYDLSEKILRSDYTTSDGQKRKGNISFNDEYQVSTGPIDKDTKESLQDLLISEDVHVIISEKFISVEVTNKDEDIFSESEDLHPLIIKYRPNYTNIAFNRSNI